MGMRAGFLIVVLAFFASLGYVVWHLWRITPGGWPWRLVVVGLFLVWFPSAWRRSCPTWETPG